jgi:hypothetical protein
VLDLDIALAIDLGIDDDLGRALDRDHARAVVLEPTIANRRKTAIDRDGAIDPARARELVLGRARQLAQNLERGRALDGDRRKALDRAFYSALYRSVYMAVAALMLNCFCVFDMRAEGKLPVTEAFGWPAHAPGAPR